MDNKPQTANCIHISGGLHYHNFLQTGYDTVYSDRFLLKFSSEMEKHFHFYAENGGRRFLEKVGNNL
jgi:hypothetical protein